MLRSRCFPVRFKDLVCSKAFVRPCCVHVACFKNLVCSKAFVHVAFMLRPCCFPNVLKASCFPGLFVHVACAHVASKRLQTPGVFRGLCACYCHTASMLLSKTFQQPCVFAGFCACCSHDLSMLLPKPLKSLVFAQVFVPFAFMLHPCCFSKRFKNLVFSQVFAHVAFMLRPCCFAKCFKNLMFSKIFVHVTFMLRPCCFPNISIFLFSILQHHFFQMILKMEKVLKMRIIINSFAKLSFSYRLEMNKIFKILIFIYIIFQPLLQHHFLQIFWILKKIIYIYSKKNLLDRN